MDIKGLAKVAYESLSKEAKNFYSDKGFKQQFLYTMSKDDASKELEFLNSDEGKQYYDKQQKLNKNLGLAYSHAMVTAPATAGGIAYGMARGNKYGKGLKGAIVGGALAGIPTGLAVHGLTVGLDKITTKAFGTFHENRTKAVQGRYDKLVKKEQQ